MDTVEKIKQRLSIVEVVGSYLDLKKSGKNYKALCPFHAEDTPSFMVSPELGIYKCFGCGASGDIFTFVQEIDGLAFYDVLKKFAEKTGVELEKAPPSRDVSFKQKIYKANRTAQKFYTHLLLEHKSGKTGLDYLLNDRGLERSVIDVFKLGYSPKTWDLLNNFLKRQGFEDELAVKADLIKARKERSGYYDKFRGRIIFPLISTAGKVQGFMGRTIYDEEPKYLNTSDTPVFSKSNFVYGLGVNRLGVKKKGAVFVEGPMDVVSAYQHGIDNVIAPLGTSLTAGHLKTVSRYTKDIVFCFDTDAAGLEAIKRAVLIADKQGLDASVVMLPPDYKDLDDLLVEDPNLGKEVLSAPVSIYDFFIAYAMKRHDPKSGVGKKNIVAELSSLFKSISNEVALEHFVKKISNELDISEKAIHSVFSSEVSVDEISRSFSAGERDPQIEITDPTKEIETYFLALLISLEDISQIKPFLEDSPEKYFLIEKVRRAITGLRSFLNEKEEGELDIRAFTDTMDEQSSSFVSDLYLWEKFPLEEEKILSEIEKVLERLKRRHARSSIEHLTKELSLAEMQGDLSRVKEIAKKIKEYSQVIK